MASIGHELRHAIEVLSEPNVRNYSAVQSFFDREGPTGGGEGRFETPAAVRTGLEVVAEFCAPTAGPLSLSRCADLPREVHRHVYGSTGRSSGQGL